MKKFCLILAVFAFFANSASAGQFLKIGDKAPEFSLVNASGNEVRLIDFKEKKNVVLFFYAEHS
jgi:peroxiredoxin